MKHYEYDPKRYFWKVKMSGLIGLLVTIYSLLQIVLKNYDVIWVGAFIVGLYTFWEVYISNSNPNIVELSNDYISFSSFGRTHEFKLSEIKQFKVKEFSSAKKMFIRINNPGFFKGRYWVNCFWFNDGDELFIKIRELEYVIEPNSMKAYARNTSKKDYEKRNIKSK